ncbi:MAG: hypothetical protein IPL49_10840 [Saprospirales bacterium]|nr:hypothetical protein [Saprospirales bacterium]MBK8491359.1 hypothetical protein [Saprospirales bacterium]
MKKLAYRLGFVLPLAVFGVFVLLILLGIGTNLLGSGDPFYCNIYCKAGVGLFVAAIVIAVLTQVTAWLHESSHEPPHLPA